MSSFTLRSISYLYWTRPNLQTILFEYFTKLNYSKIPVKVVIGIQPTVHEPNVDHVDRLRSWIPLASAADAE